MNLTQEQKLQTLLMEISTAPAGYIAVHVYLSKVSKKDQNQQKIKIALSMLEKSINYSNSKLFFLGNSDVIIISRTSLLKKIYNSLEEIKKVFARDIVIINDYEGNFFKIFSLDDNFEEFEKDVMSLLDLIDTQGLSMSTSLPPMTPEMLGDIALKLETLNIYQSVKKQDVISIGTGNIGKIFFEECYISLKNLKKRMGLNVNLQSDKWLFQSFSETLDKKMLLTLASMDLSYHSDISLNLNLRSIDSIEFKQFLQKYTRTLVVELQVADIFQDIKLYEYVKRILREKGHKIAIDSVNDETLKLLDLSLLDPDYVKIMWNPSYLQGVQNVEEIRNVVETIGHEKIVLCRCSDETAIRWGLERQISIYQGYFVDNIVGAMIRKQCDFSKTCRIPDCTLKRPYLAIDMKEGCKNIAHLDANPRINMKGAL